MKKEVLYQQLLERYMSGKATDDELIVFFELLKENELDQHLAVAFDKGPEQRVSRLKRNWGRIAAAAVVLAAVSIIIYIYSARDKHANTLAGNERTTQGAAVGYSIILMLPDGSSVNLDSASVGRIADIHGIEVIKDAQGGLLLQGEGSETQPARIAIRTPKGKLQHILLPDGTAVWLNAMSTLGVVASFPQQRLLDLHGQAYFEVKEGTGSSFGVRMNGGAEAEVVGTNFDLSCYPGEPISATLLEGVLKLRSGKESVELHSGYRALIDENGSIRVSEAEEAEQSISWRDNILRFHRADISSVLNKLERWYDIEVVYKGKIPEREFSGKIAVHGDISEVLRILRISGIRCEMEGRRVIVYP